MPSSSIEAANAKVSVITEPQNPDEMVVGRGPYQSCMVILGRPNALVDMVPTNHRFKNAPLFVGVVELGLNLEP